MGYRRGFKADAERLALSTRRELGLGAYGRLNPLNLAEHLGIPVMSLSALAERSGDPDVQEAVATLTTTEVDSVSALTVVKDSARAVVYNDAHSTARTANSITHECCHGLLLHPPAPALDHQGCRAWNADHEDEASYLAGALLIPAKAAWSIARQRLPLDSAAEDYGCSEGLVRWRVNITGARRLLTT